MNRTLVVVRDQCAQCQGEGKYASSSPASTPGAPVIVACNLCGGAGYTLEYSISLKELAKRRMQEGSG